MSKLATKSDLQEMYSRILPYLGGQADAGFTPVGTIISVMGTTAPANYLKCDGTVYNISDYPELADYFYQQFDSKNKFGGNGTTTFAVPDLRGEFLRGSGTNSHTNQGNGANVGVHQDATAEVKILTWNGDNKLYIGGKDYDITNLNADTSFTPASVTKTGRKIYNPATTDTFTTDETHYTSRPTNTSVLYCIATKNIYLDPSQDYSTSEKVIGHWINGKTLYQRTIETTMPTITTDGTPCDKRIVLSDIDNIEMLFVSEALVILLNKSTFSLNTAYINVNDANNAVYFERATVAAGGDIYLSSNRTSFSDKTVYITIRYTKTS